MHLRRLGFECTGLVSMGNEPCKPSAFSLEIVDRLVIETATAGMGDMVNKSANRSSADTIVKIHG